MQLTFGMYGDGDFFTMKGVIEELLYQTGLRKKAQYDPHAELPFLHPGRKAAIVYDGAVIGYLGEVHPTVAANYAIKERVYIAVIDMPEMHPLITNMRELPTSRFLPVTCPWLFQRIFW